MTSTRKIIADFLRQPFVPPQQKIYDELIKQTTERFVRTIRHQAPKSGKNGLRSSLVLHLYNRIIEEFDTIRDIRGLMASFQKTISKAVSQKEREECILELAADLGQSTAALRNDRRAMKRWLGEDCMLERCTRRIGGAEYRIAFFLQCLSTLASQTLHNTSDEQECVRLWKSFSLEKLLERVLNQPGDDRLRIAIFTCLATSIKALPESLRTRAVKDSTLNYVYRATLETRQHIWIQTEALQLLAVLSPESFTRALNIRLTSAEPGDDIFVRYRAVKLIGDFFEKNRSLLELLPACVDDPSPYVRQAIPTVLTKILAGQSSEDSSVLYLELLSALTLGDTRHEVRAAALLSLEKLMQNGHFREAVTDLLQKVFEREQNAFVLRTALHVFRKILQELSSLPGDGDREFFSRLERKFEKIHRDCDDLAIRRWAAQTINSAEVFLDPQMANLYHRLDKKLRSMPLGKSSRLPRHWFTDISETCIGRTCALLAEQHGWLTLHRGLWGFRLTKGDRFGFRLWRFLYEFFRPSPDKRQAHSHTVGRRFRGLLQAPGPIMAELTQTKVPGEPVLQSTENGWRPYLPLLDQVIYLLSRFWTRKPLRCFTAEGITTIRVPGNLFRRLLAVVTLTLKFSHYARLRNWGETSGESADTYIRKLEQLGCIISFTAYGRDEEQRTKRLDPAVSRFFPVLSLSFDQNLGKRLWDYMLSVYENSLYELAIFSVGLTLLFFGLRLYAALKVRNARRHISLVIGGWGTRGKSGVERLKAALFESQGYGMLSKSTGCEAMFLHADPFGKTQEMFLFRPYDKATIWEHHHLIQLADQMDCSVFLWECMGLTPAYVEILQHNWSRDDISTLTNTYPDHEDIQGPAGYDIPKVMTSFIPRKGTLITTEEQMLPILQENADTKKTDFLTLGWLEAGLLAPDILQRFPYEEHPYNIALVAKLAEKMGIARDLALKEMADRVIPDIGVLKGFPIAKLAGRELEFVNGMSANERFATLSNWRRMKFETGPDGPNPGIWLHVLVNNRADRISRSQMFGSILAQDISADNYILIGSNLSGLKGYILDAWHTNLTHKCERLSSSDIASYQDFFKKMSTWLRIPVTEEFLKQRLQEMLARAITETELATLLDKTLEEDKLASTLSGLDTAAGKELLHHVRQHLLLFREYQSIQAKLETMQNGSVQLTQELCTLLTKWFTKKISIISDYHASGDQIIDHICQLTPPGLLGRIMGVQNIKGTGLDFVYRWQAWERCWQSCNKLRSEEETIFEEGLRELETFQDFGLLCQEFVSESIEIANSYNHSQTERRQAGLKLIRETMANKIKKVKEDMKSSDSSSRLRRFGEWILNGVEAFLDAGDAIKRRKVANRIYRDLADERISHPRAAMELQVLNTRQKGGWLVSRLKR